MFDGLGSVVATVSDSGVVQSTKQYDGYGAVRASSGGTPSKHKYVGNLGHTSEDETGLIYMRARYMDPVTGRFESEDPKQDGVNWFVYCESNPVNRTDPTGEWTVADLSAGFYAAWLSSYLGVANNMILGPLVGGLGGGAVTWATNGILEGDWWNDAGFEAFLDGFLPGLIGGAGSVVGTPKRMWDPLPIPKMGMRDIRVPPIGAFNPRGRQHALP
ncbi:MAG: RHS repeat-associated core domain-containing protein [Armatimonadetes bacterium]|nr:RHS repeat-associated core domain-containing protein [Armatimonadota bacterium]